MAYCTIQDLRDEGLYVGDSDATRVQALIEEMSLWIERITQWYFEVRTSQTLTLDGTGTGTLHLPIPAITVTELRRVWRNASPPQTFVIDPTAYHVYNRRHPTDDRFNPKIRLLGLTGDVLIDGGRAIFQKGIANYEIDGSFGFVDEYPAGSATYRTPAPIKRACMLLVAHHAGELADPDAQVDRKAVDLRELTVQGREYKWDGPLSTNTITGVPEVDRILAQYRAPMAVRAA